MQVGFNQYHLRGLNLPPSVLGMQQLASQQASLFPNSVEQNTQPASAEAQQPLIDVEKDLIQHEDSTQIKPNKAQYNFINTVALSTSNVVI